MASLPADRLLGKQLDEYRLEGVLGQGGMARVYRGLDVNLKRWAAIKVIDAPFRADLDYITRFEREAKTIAQLRHQHIVRLYRYGQVGQLLYIAMEYIEGSDLEVVLTPYRGKQKLFPAKEAIRIIRDVCSALDYAHRNGVIHRDIKPSNIMLDSIGDDAILTDFGLVLLDDRRTRGEAFGTPHYIAPEQAISSARAVPQSDLYAVGVILYEMFTGQLPFDAPHPYDLAMLHLAEPPPPPRTINPKISPELEAVILKSLAKEPEDRFQTGKALSNALNQALAPMIKNTQPVQPAKVAQTLPTPSLLGHQLGPYIITEQINEGHLANVYRGHHRSSKHDVALKVFFARVTDDEKRQNRLQQKAQAVVALQHPHIVRVYEFGFYNELYYMAMAYVLGETLKDWLTRRGTDKHIVPLPGVNRIVRDVAKALDYAHTQDIVHGNLHPANIMLTKSGQIALTDVGLTHLIRSMNQTVPGLALRNPAYISPEQVEGLGDMFSDIYALGIIIYELTTGRVPFEAEKSFDVLRMHQDRPVPPPLQLNPYLPLAVEQVILKALAKEPNKRYGSAGELAHALAQATSGKG